MSFEQQQRQSVQIEMLPNGKRKADHYVTEASSNKRTNSTGSAQPLALSAADCSDTVQGASISVGDLSWIFDEAPVEAEAGADGEVVQCSYLLVVAWMCHCNCKHGSPVSYSSADSHSYADTN